MNLNTVPKMGPPGGPIFGTACTAWWGNRGGALSRSRFWDRQAVPKMRPQNRKIHSKGRPLQQTKNYNCIYLSNQHIDLEQFALPVAISRKVSLKPKLCVSATLIQKTSKNEPKHGPKNGTARRSHFWDRTRSLVKEQKKSTFHGPIFGTVRRYQK